MNGLQRWFVGLAATAVASAVAFVWLDRPIALLVHHQLHPEHRALFAKLTHIPDPLVPAAVLAFVVLGLMALAGRPLAKMPTVLFVAGISLIVAEALKNELKYVFGRTWPDTWIHNNPSFIRDGVYGFNWFHEGAAYRSFPSGHMSATCAVIAVFWIGYPRLRPLYAVVVLAVAVGLIGADYHFLSDVIAGSFVGASTGWMVTALIERRAPLRVPAGTLENDPPSLNVSPPVMAELVPRLSGSSFPCT